MAGWIRDFDWLAMIDGESERKIMFGIWHKLDNSSMVCGEAINCPSVAKSPASVA